MAGALEHFSLSELMGEVGRRLACSEKKPQNLVLVGEAQDGANSRMGRP